MLFALLRPWFSRRPKASRAFALRCHKNCLWASIACIGKAHPYSPCRTISHRTPVMASYPANPQDRLRSGELAEGCLHDGDQAEWFDTGAVRAHTSTSSTIRCTCIPETHGAAKRRSYEEQYSGGTTAVTPTVHDRSCRVRCTPQTPWHL